MSDRFQSVLADELEAFLEFKRAMGFRYERPEGTLLSFDRHIRRSHRTTARGIAWDRAIETWLHRRRPRKAITVATDLQVIRQFCLFRRRTDPRAFVPEVDWASVERTSHFLPYIFSASEIRQMVEETDRSTSRLRYNRCLRLLLLVLYCTGLRFGEVARLRMADLDLQRLLLHIRQSKGRSRLVPFRSDLAEEFEKYFKDRTPETRKPESPVFLNSNGQAHSTSTISYGLRNLLRKVGLKKSPGRNGPRPYDLRHTFAVHRLSRWYRQGVDPTERLPWLSIYMGHADILGTETYLTATPELQKMTARRFEARFRKCHRIR